MDKQIHEFLPPTFPIDLQSAIPIQRQENGVWVDDAITPQMIMDQTAGGGLTPIVVTDSSFELIPGRLHLVDASGISFTLPTLVDNGTRWAIACEDASRSFTLVPSGSNIMVQGNGINQNVNSAYVLQNNGFPYYLEVVALSSNQYIATASVNISVEILGGGGGN